MKDTMGSFFGFTLSCLGVVAVGMGVWGIYSNYAIIGAFLLFGGGAAVLAGARLASMPAQSKKHVPVAGNLLFALCFVVSILLLFLGLKDIFTNTLVGLYFLVVAFAGASLSAWSVVRASRLG